MGLHYNIPSNIKDYENPQREYEEDVAVLEKEDEVYKIIYGMMMLTLLITSLMHL